MFFIISKILAFFLNPLIWIILFALLAYLSKHRKKSRRFLLIAIGLFYFFSNSFIVSEVIRVWEKPFVKINTLNTYDAGIILGGGMATYDKQFDRITYRTNIDRLMQTIDLYKQGIIKNILISGGPGNLVFRDMNEAKYLRSFLISINIPAEHILVDSLSDNTHENAVFSKEIIDNKFADGNFLLITSAIHMRRSVACYKKEGVIADIYPTNKFAGPRRYQFDHLFIPEPVNFILWDKLIHELVGYVVYYFVDYI